MIKDDVWLEADVIVNDGLIIGDGAIVGAVSVVTKDIPHCAVIVDMPE